MRLDHLGIAVANIDEAARLWRDALGLDEQGREVVEDQGVTVLKLSTGNSSIELLEPLDQDGPVGKFLAKKGPGIHHLCFSVEDVAQAGAAMENRGFRPLWPAPRAGAGGCLVQFFHPSQTGGVLIELSQPPVTTRPGSGRSPG